MVPTMRLRARTADGKNATAVVDKRKGSELFSDDDEDEINPSSSASNEKTSITSTDVGPGTVSDLKKSREVSFLLPHNSSFEERDDVDEDLDLLNKTIEIANIDEIDHVGLMKGMHERFCKKQEKWERLASSYSKWAFTFNFFILIMQIVQMLFQQLVEIFNADTAKSQVVESVSKFTIPRVGLYKRLREADSDLTVLNSSPLQALRCVLAAFTALAAGLQMKLKLTEKSEKYRRGAKVYARLHRISTYYLMLVENGGKVEDVTGLWRDAMKQEGKWIPAVKAFMAV